ncbi:DUF4304 domain-containing protein [Undibacterium cyanobacteriorum]|uniref:DUF4304 domain-containing protein n=1 Tax=Undibacterium cyanobacteriorum TaxID=3073561 RepID=A0ABY9RJW1_9BURK|nr:DUF4304 domain-containing protein [Undibacterium sp. 20NA77.5]WMW81494.1 DUF4304 domain-containing protein [Undibacterium sp. 20NA77.5]
MWKKIKDLFSVKIDGEASDAEHELESGDVHENRPGSDKSEGDNKSDGPNLSDLIRQHLAPVLRADGFTGSGRNFRKIHTDWVLVLSVETSRAGNAFALNLGIQAKFAPDSLGKEVDPKKIKVQLCEFRRRVLTPEIDVWWKFDSTPESMSEALQSAAQCYVQQIRSLARAICSENSPFASITPDDFSVEKMGFNQFDTTEGRLALSIARYRMKYELYESAQAFAQLGLKYVGISVGLQRDLEELIEEAIKKREKVLTVATSADVAADAESLGQANNL